MFMHENINNLHTPRNFDIIRNFNNYCYVCNKKLNNKFLINNINKCCSLECIKRQNEILNNPLNKQDDQGRTILMEYCSKGHILLVIDLIKRGAHIHVRDNLNKNAFDHACENGENEVMEYICKLLN
jgi:hypothetical protein